MTDTKVPFNDLSRAIEIQREGLESAYRAVLNSGWLINGPQVKEFRETFAQYLGVKYVLGVASGTDALEIALRAVRQKGRTTVVTVANAGGYTTCAAEAAGYSVVFVDIDKKTHCLDSQDLVRVVNEQTAAVVVTHLYGRVVDVESVRRICEPLGVAVIEDCAQAAGAGAAGSRAGSLGDLATFSFYPTKNLAALGDGGAIATNSPHLIETIERLAQYGWDHKYYQTVRGGRNSRLDECQAAVLNFRLPFLEAGNERRRQIVKDYANAASDRIAVLPVSDSHAAHLCVVETDDAHCLEKTLAQAGICTDIHYPLSDDLQPARRGERDRILPVTQSFQGKILSLPCFPELSRNEIERVQFALASY